MEAIATQIASANDLGVHVLHHADLKVKGLNLLYAVGQGARYAPRLVALEYRGGDAADPFVMLVGKGITYDTGGLNIKVRKSFSPNL